MTVSIFAFINFQSEKNMRQRLWLASSQQHVIKAQRDLLAHTIPSTSPAASNLLHSFDKVKGINFIDSHHNESGSVSASRVHGSPTRGNSSGSSHGKRHNYLLVHGYGAGLAFFYPIIKLLLQNNNNRIMALDWLGMGGSDRPLKSENGHAPKISSCGKRDGAVDGPTNAVNFFIDSLEQWRMARNINEPFTLVGHSLGGYLAGRYALKYPSHVSRLVLVSPAGLPEPPNVSNVTQERRAVVQVPLGLRLLETLWNLNFTPQGIVRILGPRGQSMVQNIVRRRFHATTFESEKEADLIASYLYHITVQPASGEYALNSILTPVLRTHQDPHIYTRQPLIPMLRNSSLNIKTDIIYGDTDWLATKRAIHSVIDLEASAPAKNYKLHIIKGGHHLYLDNPSTLHRILTRDNN